MLLANGRRTRILLDSFKIASRGRDCQGKVGLATPGNFGLPPISDLQSLNAPEMRERHRLSEIPHPTAGTVPNIEPPIGLSLTPTVDPVAAPLLGQHTKDVLRNALGYDDDRIAELTKAGVFGAL